MSALATCSEVRRRGSEDEPGPDAIAGAWLGVVVALFARRRR